MSSPVLDYAAGTSGTTGGIVAPPSAGSLAQSGSTALANGDISKSVVFAPALASAAYAFDYLYVENTTDSDPTRLLPMITAKDQFGFTVDLGGATDSNNYTLKWRVTL